MLKSVKMKQKGREKMTGYIKDIPLWDRLKSTDKPILLYGMGNGADMIIANGENPNILYDIIDGKEIGTRFIKNDDN